MKANDGLSKKLLACFMHMPKTSTTSIHLGPKGIVKILYL